MNKLVLATTLGAACLALAACGDADTNMADANNVAATGDAGGSVTASAFPKGARIVEENGVTYRVDADGTRVVLGANDSRIVVENDVRYRVDPDGTRVRIDPEGAVIDIDLPDVDLPDVDVGINDKGNPDIDVKDKKDGNDGPN
ncbi:MAG TPA: hypothetical protein VFZ91_04950 [Allosphingosinicella sp.]